LLKQYLEVNDILWRFFVNLSPYVFGIYSKEYFWSRPRSEKKLRCRSRSKKHFGPRTGTPLPISSTKWELDNDGKRKILMCCFCCGILRISGSESWRNIFLRKRDQMVRGLKILNTTKLRLPFMAFLIDKNTHNFAFRIYNG